MKNAIKSILLGMVILGATLIHAQDTTSMDLPATNIDWATAPDWLVAMTAIMQTPPLPATDATNGTFWSATHNLASETPWPPLPMDPGLPVWRLSDNGTDDVFLLDDVGFSYGSAKTASTKKTNKAGTMMPADDSPITPGDGSTNDYSPAGLVGLTPDYGTNLFIAQMSQSEGNYLGIMSNSLSDIQYEIEYSTNLLSTNWLSADPNWFFYGSEVTNWTTFDVPMFSSSNMFFRVRSWQSMDGSGLPTWWEEEYFNTNNVDPYGDPMGDGWNNLEKFQNGMNPNVFYTPPAPQNVTSSYDPTTGKVTVNWSPASGPVSGYTVKIDGIDYNLSAGSTSFQNNIADDNAYSDTFNMGPNSYLGSVEVIANYIGGNFSVASVPLQTGADDSNFGIAYLASGQNGQAYLTVPALPSGTVAVQITRMDYYAEGYGDDSFDTNFDLPISAFTNGVAVLPAPWSEVCPVDGYGISDYEWWIQTVDAQGNISGAASIGGGYADYGSPFYNDYSDNYTGYPNSEWPSEPWFDGREQLKQNLIFMLRAGLNGRPFSFTALYTNGIGYVTFNYPTNYAYASFYEFGATGAPNTTGVGVFLPFGENYLYDNFIFDSSALNGNGLLLSFDNGAPSPPNLGLEEPPLHIFNPPSISGTAIAPILATNGWILSSLSDYSSYGLGTDPTIGIIQSGVTNEMVSGYQNTFGLPFLSAEFAWGSSGSDTGTLYPGDNTTEDGTFYAGTAEPELETVGYEFCNSSGFPFQNTNSLPGMPGFSTTTTNQLLIAGLGQQAFRVAGFAKEVLLNGYSGVYGYLGQYFQAAYQLGTTNQTGILSPYGDFFATQPGPVTLVTMPDPDTGQQGTCTVYAVSLALDANHDGNMDLNFGGTDATSLVKPYVFWCNNNFDRWDIKDNLVFDETQEDDVLPGDNSDLAQNLDPYAPDCNYSNVVTGSGVYIPYRAIPDTRDLEDFARLWVCGATSNLLATLPTNSTVTLSWGDVGNPNPNNPTIDIFQAADPNGGIGYLTNETVATEQINPIECPYIGRVGPGQSVQLNAGQFASNWAGNYFIWCGVSNGTGGLTLTIADGNGNVLAQSTAYIQIEDIKNMYERWTVGDNPNVPPMNTPALAADDLPTTMPLPFQYPPPQTGNTPYILLAHGYNMKPWEKDRFAETAFKRLYWQGYQGRFGAFNWPTSQNAIQFGNSEIQAWKSAQGLLNLLTNLDAEYQPNNVYLLAHSLGNVVAGEALRLAGSNQVVNTYIAMQGAVSSHAYDPTVPYWMPTPDAGEPDGYANYWNFDSPCYFNASAGAGTYVNFYNTNDWALRVAWLANQNVKPYGVLGYGFSPPSVYTADVGLDRLHFPGDTYMIFSYILQSQSYALGMQPNVGGVFSTNNQVNLPSVWPPDPLNNDYKDHLWHSAEFRSDNPQRWLFWDEALVKLKLKPNL
jgi:hypothetical protein